MCVCAYGGFLLATDAVEATSDLRRDGEVVGTRTEGCGRDEIVACLQHRGVRQAAVREDEVGSRQLWTLLLFSVPLCNGNPERLIAK